jgi:peptidoglycan/xylan/chitin deacetylase (PgdA/CDA1 family)
VRPAFVLSLDKELIWGSRDHTSEAEFARRNPDPRGVVRELLALLDRHEIPATWAVVGHLFLASCTRGGDGRAHPELPRPRHAWYARDWFADDPCSDRRRSPLWYGDDVLEMILGAKTRHEIGCHSFSHVVYGDAGCSAEVADADLAACIEAAARWGLRPTSFVFPRNQEGHHALLRKHGFTAFRGQEPSWYRGLSGKARRLAHFVDQAAAIPPPAVTPAEYLPGLWNIPGSMMLLHRGGMRRAIPIAMRVAKARAGIARAIRRDSIFHFWFHPFNLQVDRRAMFEGLDAILARVARERAAGALDVLTMSGVAAQMAGERDRDSGSRSSG